MRFPSFLIFPYSSIFVTILHSLKLYKSTHVFSPFILKLFNTFGNLILTSIPLLISISNDWIQVFSKSIQSLLLVSITSLTSLNAGCFSIESTSSLLNRLQVCLNSGMTSGQLLNLLLLHQILHHGLNIGYLKLLNQHLF